MILFLANLPVELARKVTLLFHPSSLADLLDAIPATRRAFSPADNEVSFAWKHLGRYNVHRIFGKDGQEFRPEEKEIPFWRLPDVYAVSWFSARWESLMRGRYQKMFIQCVFPDLKLGWSSDNVSGLKLKPGPLRPLAWLETVVLKAFRSVKIEAELEIRLAVRLAVLLDSTEIIEVVVERLLKTVPTNRLAEAVSLVVAFATAGDPDPSRKHPREWLPFAAFEAARFGATRVLKYLLHHPQHPVAYTLCNETDSLIHLACKNASFETVHYLLGNPLPFVPPPKDRPIRPGDLSGPNAPTNIRHHGHHVEHGCIRGAEPDRVVCFSSGNPLATLVDLDDTGKTVLHVFLGSRKTSAAGVAYLLEQGAEINPQPKDAPFLLLETAISNNAPDAVEVLLSRGALANAFSSNHTPLDNIQTPLHVAAYQNKPACAEVLLKHGARRDAGNESRETPLQVAVKRDNAEVATVLVKAGARLLVSGIADVDAVRGDLISRTLLNRLLAPKATGRRKTLKFSYFPEAEQSLFSSIFDALEYAEFEFTFGSP
ncbi:hypothetical protein HDU96_002676 [Phlyctochytrium bullatum]|nr:hypothetical protein HDU96_002676 [Phlyctochytrium bullatum]